MFDEINFSETDMDYIYSFYPSSVTENLMKLAGTDENLDNPNVKMGIEEALYQLKAMSENRYNNDCWRMLLFSLKLISDRCDSGDFDYIEEED